nr:MAG TPA: hypothetical protein [Caudoviricetes sp.]
MDNLIFVSAKTHKEIHDAYNKNLRAKRAMQEKLKEIRRKRDNVGGGAKKF